MKLKIGKKRKTKIKNKGNMIRLTRNRLFLFCGSKQALRKNRIQYKDSVKSDEKVDVGNGNADAVTVMEERESSTVSSFDPNWNPCPICLDRVTEESYLDKCFHKFCYSCIKRWISIVASKQSSSPSSLKCPMCKTDNFSIIYGYDGTAFLQDYVDKNLRNSSKFFSEAHRYRLKCYYVKQVNLADQIRLSCYWKSRKYLQRNVFLHDWLKREIQALLQDENVDIIVHHLVGVIDSLQRGWLKNAGISTELVQKEFKMSVSESAKPFLTGRTGIFVNELELFLASGLNIEAFDKVYMKHLGWKVHGRVDDDEDDTLADTSVVPHLYFIEEEDA